MRGKPEISGAKQMEISFVDWCAAIRKISDTKQIGILFGDGCPTITEYRKGKCSRWRAGRDAAPTGAIYRFDRSVQQVFKEYLNELYCSVSKVPADYLR